MKLPDHELQNIIVKVNDVFYDKVYEDQWLKVVFETVDIDFIKEQQSHFILAAFGGPSKYSGRSPKDAHPQIFIQEEMWDLREKYLMEAFQETNAPEWMRDRWIGIDNSFKAAILKGSPSECFGRYKSDVIVNVANPAKAKKSA